MEARDSSSSGAAAAAAAVQGSGREGQVEDDGEVLTVTCKLARDAALLFQGGRYAECIEVLNHILQKKEGEDPKVLHNIAVAEYFCGGCSDPKKLLDVLNKVKKKSEDLSCSSVEDMEAAGCLGNSVTSGSKGSGVSMHLISSVDNATAYAEELDTSIVMLNTAVILFRLHEHAHALSLLEPLYQKLHPLVETIALHVCLLLVHVALASNDASRAAEFVCEKCGMGHRNFLGHQGVLRGVKQAGLG